MPSISIDLTYYKNPELVVSRASYRDEILEWVKLRSELGKHLSCYLM